MEKLCGVAKTKRKDQDILFQSERKAAEIVYTEKSAHALACIDRENERYEKRMDELTKEFDSALAEDTKSYNSKINRLKSQNHVIASSFDNSKQHIVEDMDRKTKMDSEKYSDMIEEETRKGKKRRATMLSSAKSEFQNHLETMFQDMNASQDAKIETLHRYVQNHSRQDDVFVRFSMGGLHFE